MRELNKKNILQIEVLTPLHVGAGSEKDWIYGSDFVIHEGKVKILNIHKITEFISINDLTTALLNKNGDSLIKKLGANLDKCVDKVFESNYIGTNDIKTCIKNSLSNKPIVPGSSLKGALRSIIIKYLLENSKNLEEKALLGKASDGDDFMRFIKISDAEFKKTNLVNTKIFNLHSSIKGGWKHGRNNTNDKFNTNEFNTIYEVIEPQNKSLISISIANTAFCNYSKSKPFTEKKTLIINNDISYLFKIINEHTKKYLQKEKNFFKKYNTAKTEKIIESIDSLLSNIPNNGEYCILKMAAGSGFHSITGDWQFDDYSINGLDTTRPVSRGLLNNRKSAKSRKIACLPNDEFQLMGFVKLKAISEKEISEIELNQIELEKQRKTEEDRIAEQKRIALELEKDRERKLSRYNKLICKANNLNDKGDFDKAKACILEAVLCSPEEKSHFELLENIDNAIATRNKKDEARRAQQALEQSRIDANKVPLSEKISKLTKFPTIFGSVKTWMKLNNCESLNDSDIIVLQTKLSEVFSGMKLKDKKVWFDFKKWSDLDKAVGKDVSKLIFEKVTK